jgi:hypothetical protein
LAILKINFPFFNFHFSANLATFVPKTILKLTGHSIEQWAQRIRAKMDELGAQNEHWHSSPHGARQRFLGGK